MKKILLLFITIIISSITINTLYAQSKFVRNFVESGKDISVFPYEKYININDIQAISLLYIDYKYINSNTNYNMGFIYNYITEYLNKKPVTINNIEYYIDTGILYKKFNQNGEYIYENIGLFILNECSSVINDFIDKNGYIESLITDNIITKLNKNNIYIELPESTNSKVINNLKEGNIKYLFKRYIQLLITLFNGWYFLFIIFIGLLLILIVFMNFVLKNHNSIILGIVIKYKIFIVILLLLITFVLIPFIAYINLYN